MDELIDLDRAVLAFEAQWWKGAGRKEQAIRETFDWSATQYAQRVNALVDSPAAALEAPQLVARMRRIRAARMRARTPRRVA